ncbi:MAG: integrin alpha [Thermoplasmata archaeon]|nr:integrin alpha [Thermoplasmata archaeon]
MVTDYASQTPLYRQHDIAFETLSGDAIIFYSGGAGPTVYYQIWNGTEWSEPNSFTLSTITGNIYWIEAASDPYTDEIALIVADSNSDAAGIIWNGTNFWNEQLLTTTLSIATEQCHDVVYEAVSGYAMFVWGVGTNMNSRRWLNGSWEAPLTAVNVGGTCNWFSLQSDPLSNRLVLVSVDGDTDLNTVRWSGSAWTLDTEHDASVETDAGRCADAVFETKSGHVGHIILVYSDLDTDIPRYRHFDGTTWGAITPVEATARTDDPQIIQLRAGADGTVFCAAVGADRYLNTWTWDGSAWTWRKRHSTLLSQYTNPTEAYMLAPSVSLKPGSRLEHKWNLSLNTGGNPTKTLTFFVEAYKTSNSENDNFTFFYSPTGLGEVGGSTWTQMLTVSKTTDDGLYQSFSIGSYTGDYIWIGVRDTDRAVGNNAADTLYIDHMYINATLPPMFSVVFQFTGLNASYTSMRLNFTGYRGNLSAMESGDGISFEIWNQTQRTWINDTGMSAFWNNAFVNGTYLSTTTNIYLHIYNGNLFVRIRNWNVSVDTADCWLWIDFLGIDVNSAGSRFVDYGTLTQKSPASAANPFQSALVTWDASSVLGVRYANRTITTQGDYLMQRPFGGLNYNAMRMQLIIPQSNLSSYGIVDKIWFHADATDSDTDGVIASLNNFRVYLCHTRRSPTAVSSVFEDNYGGNTPVLVFKANSFSFKEDGTWQAIDLYDIFCYDNVSNLLIEIRWSGDNGVIARVVGDDNFPTTGPYQFVFSGCDTNKTGAVLTFQYNLGFNFTLPGNLKVSVSRDNGTTWYEVQNGVELTFSGTESVKNRLKYRVEFWSQNLSRNDSAILRWINITYNANVDSGKTPLIGDPNTKFGFSLSGFADFNNDARDDIVLGAPGPPAIDYKYVSSNFTIVGTITGFVNATDDDADNATLAEQFISALSFPANHEFNTSADGWTSSRAGGDDVAITNAYDPAYGNPPGAIYTRLERRWTNFDTNGIGIWEAQFNHYLGQPLTATLEFAKRGSQWGAAGSGPRYFKVSAVAPNGTELTLYQSATITGTDAAWVKITQPISALNFFSEGGTYTLRFTTYLSLPGRTNPVYQRVNYDNIYLNFTFNPTNLLDIEFTTSEVRPSSDFYLEINYTASGEDFYLYIYNGSAWNKRVTLYKTPGLYTVYTYTLLFSEWNYGLVRVRFTDSDISGDSTKNYLNISYFRIRYNSAGNTYLYYGNYLANETRLFHDELGDFTGAENYTNVELTGGNLSLLQSNAINDEFDSDTPGGNPSGWTLTESPPHENIFVVSNTSYPSGGNSVAVYDNLTADKPGSYQGVCMYKTFSPMKQGVVDLWVNHNAGQLYLFMFASGYNPTYPVIEIVLYGWISAYNGYGWVDMDSYTLNTWWNLKIVFNSDTDTYNVYKNGVLIGENITYFDNYGPLDTLSIETWDITTCIGYVDSINVYSYQPSGILYSQEVSDPDYIYNVFTYWNSTMPPYTYINVSVSRDNGNSWTQVSNNSTYWFTANEPENKIFRYRIELGTSHAAFTPVLYNITFSFNRSRMGVIITGNVSLEGFGFSVSGGGDFDNDGNKDIILGAPYAANNRGNIYAFYGNNTTWTFQTHLYATYADITFEGEYAGDMYGYCVYGRVAHITNKTSEPEWYNEVLCGAPLWDGKGTDCGRVYIYIARGLPYVNVTWWFYNTATGKNEEIGYWNLGKVGRVGWWNGTVNITNPRTVSAGVAINMTINVTSPTGHASVRVYFDSAERCSGYTFMPGGVGMAQTEWVKVKKNGVLSNNYVTSFTTSDKLDILANISVVPGYNVSEVYAAIIRVINDSSGAIVLENQTVINPETTGTTYKIFVLYDVAHSWPAGLYKIEVDALDKTGVTDYGKRFANNKVCYIYIT